MRPLDPLNAPEFRVREAISVSRGVGPGWRFASIELRELAKPAMPGWQPGDIILREAIAVVWNRSDQSLLRDRKAERDW
jgi:primary-amine oxidase